MPDRPKQYRPFGLSKKKEATRPAYHEWYNSSEWRRRAKAKLAEQLSLCQQCQGDGIVTVATCVDHTIPHRGDRALFDDDANLESLCAPCHSRKTRAGM